MATPNDAARKWTDSELDALEKRMAKEYRQAADEMRGKLEKSLKSYEKEKIAREKALDNTKEAKEAHKRWLQLKAAEHTRMGSMVDSLAASANEANKKAASMINNHIPRIYAENANRAAFAVDKAVKADTRFALVNEDAIRYLMGDKEQGQLIHEVTLTPEQHRLKANLQSMRKDIDSAKDIRWNRQKFTSAITQGILQGESIPNIVKRTKSIYGQNEEAAYRAARTATTSAENAGRVSSYERAQRLGIDMELEWLATLDGRTRSSHRQLDGERIQLGEKFSNGLRWPGDPTGPGHELWNCRCRANGRVTGFDGKKGDWTDSGQRWSRLPNGMTYEQWKSEKPVIRAESYLNDWSMVTGEWYASKAVEAAPVAYSNSFAGVVEGRDILGAWQRRPDQYDFEIEDVMAAQGFDGKPRIVDADEFDRAVKQANNGDGLIMQRTYSAPDQETLDAYRDMLYDGKWYVDCSTGGAQYGQGMYCAADYTGKLSDGIKAEMSHYQELGEARAIPEVMATKAEDIARITVGVTLEQAESFLRFRVRGEGKAFASIPFDKLKSLGDAYDAIEAEVKRVGAGLHYTETMTLDPSAKVITWKDAMKAMDESWGPGMPGDVGSYAAAMGYDAINAAGHGVSGSYTVVLNRTKLIIRSPE